MSQQVYKQCSTVFDFARALWAAGDLDPIYEMLGRAELPDDQLKRWCLAYWWFYHAGVASHLAESHDFYGEADLLYPRCTRAAERRHFRGQKGRDCIAWFAVNHPRPESAVDSLTGTTFKEVKQQVQAWPQFGPWISFKVADMLERVFRRPVSFDDCELLIYDEPRNGAEIVAKEAGFPAGKQGVAQAIEYVRDGLLDLKAPPFGDRPLTLQEIETVLCKFKSHRKGHYPVGKDRREIKHGLDSYGGNLARRLGALL